MSLDVHYALGAFPTLELLKVRPKIVKRVIVRPNLESKILMDQIAPICRTYNIKIVKSNRVLNRISKKTKHLVAAEFHTYNTKVTNAHAHIVLVNPENGGNVGTIIRSMVAFGFNNLVVISPSVSLFHTQVVRASMGSIFKVNFTYFKSFEEYIKTFPSYNFYLFMTDGTEQFEKVHAETKKISLVFGSESSGLEPNLKKYGKAVRLFQTKEVDSLNLAISASIAMHQVAVQRFLI